MFHFCEDSFALAIVRRDSAMALQFLAMEKAGIIRFSACNPNPMMPNRTMIS
jgi:hypothetical protein